MKIAYFGYDLFYPCLEKLLKTDNVEVLRVFSFPENEDDKHTRVKELALAAGVSFTQEKVLSEDIDRLAEAGCELLVSAGYMYKIPVGNKIKGINLHPARLPIGRGPWPMPVTILKNVKTTALTVHMLADGFDRGDILHSKEYNLKKDENLETLNAWYQNNCADLVWECVTNFDWFYQNRTPQGEGEYWKMPTKSDMTVTCNTDVFVADRVVRGFYGSGFFYSDGKDERFIKRAHVEFAGEIGGESADVLAVDGGKIVVEK